MAQSAPVNTAHFHVGHSELSDVPLAHSQFLAYQKFQVDGVKSLIDWNHDGKRSAAWEVREFERGLNQPKT